MSNPAGFPVRPSRASFGPEPVNSRPVRDSSREFDGEKYGRLLLFQTAGLGLMSALAWVKLNCQVGPVILARAESWNPNAATGAPYTAPIATRQAQGHYRLEYAPEYPDHTGVLRALALQGCAPVVQDASGTIKHAQGAVLNPYTVDIRIFSGGSAADNMVVFVPIW